MKLITIGPELSLPGGISTHIHILGRRLVQKYAWFHFVWSTNRVSVSESFWSKFGLVYRTAYGFIRFTKLVTLSSKNDICHFHVSSYFGFYEKALAAIVLQLLSRNVVVTIHGGEFLHFARRSKMLVCALLRALKKVVCVDSAHRDYLHSRGVTHVGYLPNPVEIVRADSIAAGAYRSEIETAKPWRVVWASNMEPRKQAFRFLQELLRVFKAQPELVDLCRFDFYGYGEEYEKCIELRPCKSIAFFGSLSHESLVALLREYDCFVFTSKSESFGYVLAEAANASLLIMSTRVGLLEGTPLSAYYKLECDFSNLGDVLNSMINNRESDLGMKNEMLEYISQFDANRVFQSLESLYLKGRLAE